MNCGALFYVKRACNSEHPVERAIMIVHKPRHIAIYLPSLRGGGAERVMVTLANGFAARGHRVDLVLAMAEGPYLSEVDARVRLIDLDRRRVLSSLLPLVRYMRRERPDAMLSAMKHANIIAILARKLARVKMRLVVSERSAPSGNLSGGGMAPVLRLLMRQLYPRADAVVCVSRGVENELKQMFGLPAEKLRTIYNPLDIDRINQLKTAPVDHPWLAPDQPPVILSVGRLVEAKDYPNLLKAFARLRQHRLCRLIILGEGSERDKLRELAVSLGIAEDVDFPGFQDNPFAWMAACDLYVMSSAWEGLPGTLQQAMACGAKVVSTDCRTGPAEILENGKWGRLVPVGDAEALAEAMAAALDEVAPPNTCERARDFRQERSISAYLNILTA